MIAISIEKFLLTSMRYLAVSSLLLPSTLFQGVGALRCDQRFRKDLTRRANHRHMFSTARTKPAPENRPRLFDSGFLIRDHAEHLIPAGLSLFSSCPDLIRASIDLRKMHFPRGIAGSSPAMTN